MLIVSIFSACIMQHVAGFFLAPARKKDEDAVVHHDHLKDMEFPLADFKEHVGENMATFSCKSWIGIYGAASQAGCKQQALMEDPYCGEDCKNAVRKDADFIIRRCPATCERGSKLASKAKSSKSKSAWANAFEKVSKAEEQFTVEDKSQKEQKARKDRYDKRLQQREADKKMEKKSKDIKEQELKDDASAAELESEKIAAKKQKESIKVAVNVVNDKHAEEGTKQATTVEVHADVVDANKDDTKEDDKEAKKHEHPEKANAKKDESKKEVEDSKALHDKSEKKVIKAGSDEDAQAQIKAEAMKAFASKSWQKKVADMEAKDDAAKADKSWGTSIKPESGLLASIVVCALLFV